MEFTKKEYRRTFAGLGLALCLLEVLRVFGSLLYEYVLNRVWNQETGVSGLLSWLFASPWTDTLVQYVFVLGVPYLLIMALLKRMPKAERWKDSLPPGIFVAALVMSLGLGYLLNLTGVFINSGVSLFTGKPADEMNPVTDMMSVLTPSMVIYTCLLGPFMEELLFRGVLLSRARKFGDRTAVLFTAVLFGLMHGNLNQFLYAAAIGIVFGYVAVYTGRIRYTVMLHMMVNTYSVILLAGEELLLSTGLVIPLVGYGLMILLSVVLLICGAVTCIWLYGREAIMRMGMMEAAPPSWRKYAWLNVGFLLYLAFGLFQMMLYLLY